MNKQIDNLSQLSAIIGATQMTIGEVKNVITP